MSINEIQKELELRYHLHFPQSSLKRYVRKAETIFLSNIRPLIPRVIKRLEVLILNVDYMEPKSKRHKIFIAFEHDSRMPLLFKILDDTNEVDIQTLIKTQLPEIKDFKKILISDADTTLIFCNIEGKGNTDHHLCLMHFKNFCIQIAKPLNDAAFSLIKDAIFTLWAVIKNEKGDINKPCREFDSLTEYDRFCFLVSELIYAIFEIKDIKGSKYKTLRVYPYLLQLLQQFARLDPQKTQISFV